MNSNEPCFFVMFSWQAKKKLGCSEPGIGASLKPWNKEESVVGMRQIARAVSLNAAAQ